MVSVSSFFIDGPDGDELETAVALARAWAISDEYPDPEGYPGMRSARWYALNQALDDHIDVTLTTPAANQFLMYDGTEWVNAAVDASVVTYTPSTLASWNSSADPGNVDGALDQLAARVLIVEAATGAAPDAAAVTYTPGVLADWTGSADPGNVDDALDQLALRLTDVEALPGSAISYLYQLTDVVIGDVGDGDGGTQPLASNDVLMWNGFEWINHPVDASWVSFSATTVGNWDGSVNPGTASLALDQLAARVETLEVGAGAVDAASVTYTPGTLGNWTGSADPGNVDDALDQLASRVQTIQTESIIIACSDETTALTTGTSKVTFRMPYAFTLTGIRASLSTAQTSGSIFTVDVNEAGASILSTKITIDNTETTSTTAATAAVLSDTSLADDAEITIDIDQIGDGTAKGLKVTLIGRKT